MSKFTVIVFDDGVASFVAGQYAARADADKQVSDMIGKSGTEEGQSKYVFDGNDDIVVVDGDARAVSVWNRHRPKSVNHFAGFDFGAYLDHVEKRKARRLIGFQITNLEGEKIHGTDEDPFQLATSEVLIDAAVLTAKGWAADKDYLVTEVFSDGIVDPVFVSYIEIRDEPSTSPCMR